MVDGNGDGFSLVIHFCEKHKEWYCYNCADCAVEKARLKIEKEVGSQIITWLKSYRTRNGYIGVNLDSPLWREFETSVLGSVQQPNKA